MTRAATSRQRKGMTGKSLQDVGPDLRRIELAILLVFRQVAWCAGCHGWGGRL
jgi:hypothetical protein